MSCQGLQELINGYSKDLKESPWGIQMFLLGPFYKSQRTLLMALLLYKTFPLGTLLNHQGFQEVFKGQPRKLRLLMITLVSWWKNLEQLSLNYFKLITLICSLFTPPMIWNNCCWLKIVSIIYRFQFNRTFNLHLIYIKYTLNLHSICRY